MSRSLRGRRSAPEPAARATQSLHLNVLEAHSATWRTLLPARLCPFRSRPGRPPPRSHLKNDLWPCGGVRLAPPEGQILWDILPPRGTPSSLTQYKISIFEMASSPGRWALSPRQILLVCERHTPKPFEHPYGDSNVTIWASPGRRRNLGLPDPQENGPDRLRKYAAGY